jgi:uncharacterized protein (DUF488 family)
LYYRRKILLSLLQVFDGQLEKIQMQKLLLLFSKLQIQPDFDFVPYKYGCFSFQANADLLTLSKYGIVSQTERLWTKESSEDFAITLKKHDITILQTIRQQYKAKSTAELIGITYRKYPYLAIKSKIAEQYLTPDELVTLAGAKPVNEETCLYTIGYEGVSLETYLNKLIKNDVKVLCDVRRNSLSMKFGFSKNQLKAACEGVGISYYHLPELGIASEQRQTLETQADYDKLFRAYVAQTISNTSEQQVFIIQLVQQYQRVALTCFEADACQCHRSHLAEAITQFPNFSYSLKHL